MDLRLGRSGVALAGVIVLLQAGCAAPIPHEEVPAGWSLNVHQPGEWWTQPLIPRSVILERCPPPSGWSSDPDLRTTTGLPPGSSVEYSRLADDYHCSIGWSEPADDVQVSSDDLATEEGLRRVCSTSGLPMDETWRFLGQRASEPGGDVLSGDELGGLIWEMATAAFIDEHGTVVACMAENMDGGSGGTYVELAVGTDAAPGPQVCPVQLTSPARSPEGTLMEYQLRGAGAVRDDSGTVLTEATTVRLGVTGDTVTSSHPVVDGIAIVGAWVEPDATIAFDWDQTPPSIEGEVLGLDGEVMARCRG